MNATGTVANSRSAALGLGALAVIALLVLFIVTGSPQNAGATDNTPTPTPEPTDTPTPTATPEPHATPEGCVADDDVLEVVSSGSYAMFDVYWSSADVELTVNPCPPAVIHTLQYHDGSHGHSSGGSGSGGASGSNGPPDNGGGPPGGGPPGGGQPDPTATPTPAPTATPTPIVVTSRVKSHINLDKTVIHLPDNTKMSVAAGAGNANETDFPFLWADEDNDESTPKTAIATNFWALPDCDPHEHTLSDDDMCMGFSTGLLHAKHWLDAPGGNPPGKIYFEFVSVREPGVEYNDRGVGYLFKSIGDVDTDAGEDQVTWSTLDVVDQTMAVTPGTYEHRRWGFTKPGTYVFQVDAYGYPQRELGATTAKSRSSVARTYKFHVGLMADLSVTGSTATEDGRSPGHDDPVTYTITAKNNGPDEADNTKVSVHIPEGLSYSTATGKAPSATQGTYDKTTGVWSVGTLDAPGAGETETTETLTLYLTVDSTAALGEDLVTNLEIHATEDIGSSSHVRELDPHTDNNASTVSVTPLAEVNNAPSFYVSSSIAENSAAGAHVGSVITASDPDDGATLTYTITGDGAENFAANTVATGAQVVVAKGASLNYEDTTSYNLVLNVSDGLDENSNVDTSADATIGLRISVTDVETETLSISLSADRTSQTVGGKVKLWTAVNGASVANDMLRLNLHVENKTGQSEILSETVAFDNRNKTVTYNTALKREYKMSVWRVDSNGDMVAGSRVYSDPVVVTWTAASE